MKYILASASPRRKELLSQAGFSYEVIPSDVDEKISCTIPSDVVIELAHQKAWDVFQKVSQTAAHSDCVIIGADTIVAYNGEILGKPDDAAEAYDMLSMLSDRTHQVYTGVSLVIFQNGQVRTHDFFEQTDVTFYPVSRQELLKYTASKDSLDKAGAYGIQGPFAIHVKGISGDYNNVVGLPISRLYQELKALNLL